MKRNNDGLIVFVVILTIVWICLMIFQIHLVRKANANQKELFHVKVDDVFEKSLVSWDTIDFQEIDACIREELHHQGINDPYYLGLYCNDDSTFLFVSDEADPELLLAEGFQYNLLSISDDAAHLDTLYIYFPHLEKRFHRDVVISYHILFFLLALLLCLFVVFVIVLYRQRQINVFREKMVTNITHELKTPLTTINLASQLLLDDSVGKDAEVQGSYLRMISDETKAMQSLVDEALEIFKKSKTSRERTDIMVHKLLTTIVEVHRLSLNECHGEVVFNFQASEDVVYGDLTHLANAFSNLIDNAIKYRKEEPLIITISTRNVGETIEISFADNGIGISSEDQKLIFEPFTRVNTNNKYYVKGYGLGLNYVLHVVEYHKGSIKVESELGKGSNFVITLPLELKGILI